jgi:hypothetical protein
MPTVLRMPVNQSCYVAREGDMGRHNMYTSSEYLQRLHSGSVDQAEKMLEVAESGESNSTALALIGIGHALMALNYTMERIADRIEEPMDVAIPDMDKLIDYVGGIAENMESSS